MTKQPFYVILVETNEFKRVMLNPKIVREETPELAVSKLLSKDPDEYKYVIQAFAFPVKDSRFKITRFTGCFSGSPNFMIERTE